MEDQATEAVLKNLDCVNGLLFERAIYHFHLL